MKINKKQKVEEPLYVVSSTNQQLLNYKAYKMEPNEKMLYFLAAFIVGAVVGFIFYGGIGKDEFGQSTVLTYILNVVVMVLAGLTTGKVFLPIRKAQIIKKRKKELRTQFIALLDSLSTSIAAGRNVPNAFIAARDDLRIQYPEEAYIIQEVNNIIGGIRNNISVGSMLMDFGERSGIKDIQTFGKVFETAYDKGANLKDVVRNSNEILSTKIQIEEEIETKVASTKNEQNIMLIMPIILVGMIKLSGGDFANNFTTVKGIITTTISIGIFVVAYFVGRKILNIEV
ncbi:MAG: type II secretion system F family protein [Acutalibacteraceae bacterium]